MPSVARHRSGQFFLAVFEQLDCRSRRPSDFQTHALSCVSEKCITSGGWASFCRSLTKFHAVKSHHPSKSLSRFVIRSGDLSTNLHPAVIAGLLSKTPSPPFQVHEITFGKITQIRSPKSLRRTVDLKSLARGYTFLILSQSCRPSGRRAQASLLMSANASGPLAMNFKSFSGGGRAQNMQRLVAGAAYWGVITLQLGSSNYLRPPHRRLSL